VTTDTPDPELQAHRERTTLETATLGDLIDEIYRRVHDDDESVLHLSMQKKA
jgi:hypothetical protein